MNVRSVWVSCPRIAAPDPRVRAARLPKASPKGMRLYGMTRSTQIRRFRAHLLLESSAERLIKRHTQTYADLGGNVHGI